MLKKCLIYVYFDTERACADHLEPLQWNLVSFLKAFSYYTRTEVLCLQASIRACQPNSFKLIAVFVSFLLDNRSVCDAKFAPKRIREMGLRLI